MRSSMQATTAERPTNTILINPPNPQQTWTRHSPVIMATIVSPAGEMSSCQDVREIYQHCLVSHSTDTQCKKAASYFSICMIKDLE